MKREEYTSFSGSELPGLVWRSFFVSLVLLLSFSAFSLADASGGATVCTIDPSGKETCNPISEAKLSQNGFYVKEQRTELMPWEVAEHPQSHVKIIVFGNLQSLFYEAVDSAIKQLQTEYGDKVSVEFHHYAPKEYVLYADKVAEASECARDQSKFGEFKQKVFDTIGEVQDKNLLDKHALEAGLNVTDFDACIASNFKKSIVEKDMLLANKSGVNGEPAVFIGSRAIFGAYEHSAFKAAVDSTLEGTTFVLRNFKYLQIADIDIPKPKHNPQVETRVADATDFYESSPQVFHLKLSVPKVVNWEKLSTIIEDSGATIEKIDKEQKIIYATASSSKIDELSRNYGVYIFFDDRYPVPTIATPTPVAVVNPISPTIVPVASAKPPVQETSVPELNEVSAKSIIRISLEGKQASLTLNAGGLVLESSGIQATTGGNSELTVNSDGLALDGVPMKLLPDEALKITSNSGEVRPTNIALNTVNSNPAYEISGEKEGKLLGFLPANYPIKVIVNANDGTLERVDRPWWSALVN